MKKLSALLLLILGLTSVITVHEFGHFIICKLFTIATPIFSIGFGPTLFGYTFGDTFFQIALLPLGGYVAIDSNSLATRPYFQKFLINIAGISFNLIFALILLMILFYLVSKREVIPIIEQIEENSPARNAGLLVGDLITQYDTHSLACSNNDDSIATFFQTIRTHPNQPLLLHIIRQKKPLTITIPLASNHPQLGDEIGYLGVQFKEKTRAAAPLFRIIWQSLTYIAGNIQQLAYVVCGIFKKENRSLLRGPIGIVTSISHPEPYLFITWLALMNINVAFFNILPFPFLDGGHIALDTIELLYGKPLPATMMQIIHTVSIFLFIWFMLHISLQDIQRIKRKSGKN